LSQDDGEDDGKNKRADETLPRLQRVLWSNASGVVASTSVVGGGDVWWKGGGGDVGWKGGGGDVWWKGGGVAFLGEREMRGVLPIVLPHT
jgi:hypothetical protein